MHRIAKFAEGRTSSSPEADQQGHTVTIIAGKYCTRLYALNSCITLPAASVEAGFF